MNGKIVATIDSPCPNCGAIFTEHVVLENDGRFHAECNNADCGHKCTKCKTIEKAISAWDKDREHIANARRKAKESYDTKRVTILRSH